MTQPFRLACLQMNAGDDLATNIDAYRALATRAIDQGAQLIASPENTSGMYAASDKVKKGGLPESSHPMLASARDLAAARGVWLLLGSIGIASDEEDGRIHNRSYLIRPDASIAARYDKIHMFDVHLPNGEVYRESDSMRPGRVAPIVDLPWGRLGLTICYDLRFPHLFRRLAQAGADFIAVPAAFTHHTGERHWHTLLRARAIETGAYVFAPAQCGQHPGGRRTYGHTLIIHPDGHILADGGDMPGFVIADIDPALVKAARAQIPAWSLERDFEIHTI